MMEDIVLIIDDRSFRGSHHDVYKFLQESDIPHEFLSLPDAKGDGKTDIANLCRAAELHKGAAVLVITHITIVSGRGRWSEAPVIDLYNGLKSVFGDIPIIGLSNGPEKSHWPSQIDAFDSVELITELKTQWQVDE